MKTMKDYHDLKSDLLLLPDVFQNFRIIASKIMNYEQAII